MKRRLPSGNAGTPVPGRFARRGPRSPRDDRSHAGFGGVGGPARRVRGKSGSGEDGAKLVDEVFLRKNPVLAFNALKTQTEKSEHGGFAALLKGCFAAVRNPHAHTPKIHWEGEDNAADYFTLISMSYCKVDSCHTTA